MGSCASLVGVTTGTSGSEREDESTAEPPVIWHEYYAKRRSTQDSFHHPLSVGIAKNSGWVSSTSSFSSKEGSKERRSDKALWSSADTRYSSERGRNNMPSH